MKLNHHLSFIIHHSSFLAGRGERKEGSGMGRQPATLTTWENNNGRKEISSGC
jgi:hypothetical protein